MGGSFRCAIGGGLFQLDPSKIFVRARCNGSRTGPAPRPLLLLCEISRVPIFRATYAIILSKFSNISVTPSAIAIFLHGRAESNAMRRDENNTAKRQRGSAVRRIVPDAN